MKDHLCVRECVCVSVYGMCTSFTQTNVLHILLLFLAHEKEGSTTRRKEEEEEEVLKIMNY